MTFDRIRIRLRGPDNKKEIILNSKFFYYSSSFSSSSSSSSYYYYYSSSSSSLLLLVLYYCFSAFTSWVLLPTPARSTRHHPRPPIPPFSEFAGFIFKNVYFSQIPTYLFNLLDLLFHFRLFMVGSGKFERIRIRSKGPDPQQWVQV